MKKLILLRHAKSSWEDFSKRDFDRELNSRGVKSAKKVAAYLEKENLFPDLIISSPAIRTLSTVNHIFDSLDKKCQVIEEKSLYLGDISTYVLALCMLDETLNTAMIVGHNSGIQEFASVIAKENIIMKTASLVIFEFEDCDFTKVEKYKLKDIVHVSDL